MKKTEEWKIFDEWYSLYELCSSLNEVNIVSFPKKSTTTCGSRINHIKEDNYRQIYESLFNENNYSILMMDGGLISLFYEFDDSGNVISHSLHYLPNIFIDCDEDDIYHLFSNYTERNILSKYVRVDFGKLGFKEHIHSECHIHLSLNKDAIRIPCESWVSPMEFYMFVMTYIYQKPFDRINTSKRQVLTANELLKYYLKLGS